MEDARPIEKNVRLWIVVETVTLCGLGLVAACWLIPAQTTPGGIGLDPSVLPTVCVLAAMALVALDAALRLAGLSAPGEKQPPAAPALRVIAVCLVGGVLLPYANPAVCTAVLLPILMLLLGDRSVMRIAVTTIVTVAAFAAALAWRG